MDSSKVSLGVVLFGVVLLITGCAKLPGDYSSSSGTNTAREKIKKPLTALKKNFERRRLMQFSRAVHPNYRRYESQLRNNLADVYRIYSSIQLEFHGVRATRSGDRIVANVNWDLRWTCQSPRSRAPSRCRNDSDVGNVIIRRGRTDFEFEFYDGQWRLINQDQDIIFGSLAPGDRQN